MAENHIQRRPIRASQEDKKGILTRQTTQMEQNADRKHEL